MVTVTAVIHVGLDTCLAPVLGVVVAVFVPRRALRPSSHWTCMGDQLHSKPASEWRRIECSIEFNVRNAQREFKFIHDLIELVQTFKIIHIYASISS